MCDELTFEDGLNLCFEVLDGSGSLDEAVEEIARVIDVYREQNTKKRVKEVKAQLGLW